MNTNYRSLLILVLLIPFAISTAQYTGNYYTTMTLTMNCTDPSSLVGNFPSDDSISIDCADGWMNVYVNLLKSINSVLSDYMANCSTNRIIFNTTNRYMEFRLKSSAPFNSSVSFGWGSNDACPTYSNWNLQGNPVSFSYSSTLDDWQIFLLQVPKTS